MKQHKWHKEIKAWADGAEIEMWYGDRWEQVYHAPDWFEHEVYRIKPQPKEPQYVHAYLNRKKQIVEWASNNHYSNDDCYTYLGKIKLEDTE